jgi:hypothetical protein
MILYHFVPEFLLKAVKKEGLSLGVLPVKIRGSEFLIENIQWLTRNPDFTAQCWATFQCTLPYDRTAYRITVIIPKFHQKNKLISWGAESSPNNFLNKIPGWQDWYIFKGRIPPSWFRKIEKKPCR